MREKYSNNKDYSVVAFFQAMFFKDEQIRVLNSLTSKAKEHKIKFVFFSTLSDFYAHTTNDEGEMTIFDHIDIERFDALVVMGETFKDDKKLLELMDNAYKANVPCFCVDKALEHCINLHYESGDTFRDIVKHMIVDHGYHNIDFIAGIPDNRFSEERISVFKEVCKENNVDFDDSRLFYGYFWENPTVEICEQLYKRGMENTDAIICANDNMAITVIDYFQRKGFDIPKDFAVSGFDGIELAYYTFPRLTTSKYNFDALLDILIKELEKNNNSIEHYKDYAIYSSVDIGCSCGCASKDKKRAQAFPQIMKLKHSADNLINYQIILSIMNSLVSRANTIDDISDIVGHNVFRFEPKEIWICANDSLQSIYTDIDRRSSTRDRHMHVIHFDSSRDNAEDNADYSDIESFGEIIPDFDEIIKNDDFILLLPVHVNGKAMGYMAMTLDTEKFDYLCCASFINAFEYMIQIRGEQLNTMRTYLHDSLTGLYNRNGFYQKIKNIISENDVLSIISLDMDGLKYINDTFGHAEGDIALKALGRIIRNSTYSELSARIGGDEFLIAFASDKKSNRVNEIVSLIQKGIDEYNATSKNVYKIQASIGTFTGNSKSHTLDYFLKMADDLMYEMKSEHKKKL